VRIIDGMSLTEKNQELGEKSVYQNCTRAVLVLNSGLHFGNTDIVVDLEVIMYKIMSQ
jgi:hypothetical protein